MKFIPKYLFLIAMLFIVLLPACSPTPHPPQVEEPTTLLLTPCWLSSPGLPLQVEARCGELSVYENPETQSGRQINLHIAVIPAQSRSPEPDPLFLIAGGPGQASTEAFIPYINALGRVNFKRDLVMVDQRGTGKSNPLHCPTTADSDDEQEAYGQIPPTDEVAAWAEDCVEALDTDLQLYTTPFAVQDLDDVRQALGYGQINLLGVSYGTRVAQLYVQSFPEHARALILDGVVPVDWTIGESVLTDAQRSLDLIFERCTNQKECQQTFPVLTTDLEQLLAHFETNPTKVMVAHPTTSEEAAVWITPNSLGSTIRLMSYNHLTSAILPLLIHQAQVDDNLQPLAAQYLILSESLSESIADGMYYSVLCSEDIPFYPSESNAENTYLKEGTNILDAVCQVWPVDPVPASFHIPLRSDTPTLLISGEADPITPPENGEQAAAYLPNSQHIVVSEMGHSNMAEGCIPVLLRDFLTAASVTELDTTCVDSISALPFFTQPVGPMP